MSLSIADANGGGSLPDLPNRLWDDCEDSDGCMYWDCTNANCSVNAQNDAACGRSLSVFVYPGMLEMVELGRWAIFADELAVQAAYM